MNVFLVWSSYRDLWGALQDRVLGSIVGSVRGARVRVLSNTLPSDSLDALAREGFDVAVMRYDLLALLRGAGGDEELRGASWLSAMLAARSPHEAAQTSDLLRLVVLARFGGLFLDTDALWVRDVTNLPAAFVGKGDLSELGQECSWCINGRWSLANGVMSFPARHRLLFVLLRAIDAKPYDSLALDAIGPRFLISEIAASGETEESGDFALLSEVELELYLISPKVPQNTASSNHSSSMAHSVRPFAHSLGHLAVPEGSILRHYLRAVWPASRPSLCSCAPSLAAPLLCLPASLIISLASVNNILVTPLARLCVRIAATSAAAAASELQYEGRIVVTVAAQNGVISSWGLPAARTHTITLSEPTWTSDELQLLVYRHVGDYCNDLITVTATWHGWMHVLGLESDIETATVSVSAPCLTRLQLAAVHPHLPKMLQAISPLTWNEDLGPTLPSMTAADLEDEPELAATFSACMRSGSRGALLAAASAEAASTAALVAAPALPPLAPSVLRVGLLVSATGTFFSWIDGLILSAEQHFFRKSHAEVHYFILSDLSELPLGLGPVDRVHLLHQPKLGWPYDSMFRHQMYLQHRAVSVKITGGTVAGLESTFAREHISSPPSPSTSPIPRPGTQTWTLFSYLMLTLLLVLTWEKKCSAKLWAPCSLFSSDSLPSVLHLSAMRRPRHSSPPTKVGVIMRAVFSEVASAAWSDRCRQHHG